MATKSTNHLPYSLQVLASNVAHILAWDVLKRVLGYKRGFLDGLPQGPVRPSREAQEGQGVAHE